MENIVPLVVRLLNPKRPLAVVWRIPEAVVLPLDLVIFARPITHVCVEVLKVQPPVTYRYSSSTVILVMPIFLVVASLTHRHPYFELLRFVHAVLPSQRFYPFGAVATAAYGVSAIHVVELRDELHSAFAPAQHQSLIGST